MNESNSFSNEEPSFQRELGTSHLVPNQAALEASDNTKDKGKIIAQTFKNTKRKYEEAAELAKNEKDMPALKQASSDLKALYAKVSNHFNLPIGSDSFDKAMSALENRDSFLKNFSKSNSNGEGATLNEYQGKKDGRTDKLIKEVKGMRDAVQNNLRNAESNVGSLVVDKDIIDDKINNDDLAENLEKVENNED